MKNKKLFSTLVLASFLANGFIQPLSAKANTINVNGILESIKKSSGNEFKMAVQNKNQKSLSGKLSKRKTSNSSEAIKFLDEVKDVLSLKDVNNNFVTNKVIDKNNKLLSTYQFNVHYQAPDIGSYYVYVDMNTGKIVNTESRLKFDGAVTGSGTAENGTERTLNLYQSGNSYEAKDITKDMPGQISTYTANNKQEQPGKLFTSSTKTISDPAVVSAHSYAGVVYDFYKKLFNRNSIDGNGMSLISTVHYAKNYANAFWDPETNQMVYGDGDGKYYRPLCTDFDVVGHEMTHGVTDKTAKLTYANQSGALNESMSDVMGVLIQTWDKYNVQNGGTWEFNDSDWVIGDEICTGKSNEKAFRSLKDPTLYDQPDSMTSPNYYTKYWDQSKVSTEDAEKIDYGGVHTNSGIPNKAAYLVAKSIGCEKTAKIYYRALTTYFNANTNFAGAYSGLVQAATDLYGANSNEVKALTSAFTSVGIISGSQQPTTDTYEPSDSIKNAYKIKSGETYKSYISSSSDVDYYKIYVPRSKTLNITL